MFLDSAFFKQDSITLARALIGCIIETRKEGLVTSARITETEAYPSTDVASHAYGGKHTPRTAIQYLSGGHLYIYLIRGMHIMTSIVTSEEGIADVVFIRSVEPLNGIELMCKRRGKLLSDPRGLTNGPGKLSAALNISMLDNGLPINSGRSNVFLYTDGFNVSEIKSAQRINLGFKRNIPDSERSSAINAKLRFYDAQSEYLSS